MTLEGGVAESENRAAGKKSLLEGVSISIVVIF